MLWKPSEAYGKYDGCPYWSEGALASRGKYGRPVKDKRKFGADALRHEHVFPRKELVQKLFSLADPTSTLVGELVESLNIGVVVTVAEDERLPKQGTEPDPWERYRQGGVRWFSVDGRGSSEVA